MEAVSTHVRILWDHFTVAVTLDIYYNRSSSVWVGSKLGDIWCLFFFLGGWLSTHEVIAIKRCNVKNDHSIIRLCYSNQFWIWYLELCEMAVLLFHRVIMYITNIRAMFCTSFDFELEMHCCCSVSYPQFEYLVSLMNSSTVIPRL